MNKVSNKPSFITDLLAHAGSVGFQRSNKYIVFINGPGTKNSRDGNPKFNYDQISKISETDLKRLALTCTSAELPGRRISTEDVRYYNLGTKMPNFETYTQELTLNFLCSSDMFERMYFKNWQDKVMNPITHSPNMYDEYAKPFTITIMVLPDYVNSFAQLGKPLAIGSSKEPTLVSDPFDERNPSTSGIYFIKCLECYPTEITAVKLGTEQNAVLEMSVTMAFRKWIDPLEQFEKAVIESKTISDEAYEIETKDGTRTYRDSADLPYADRGNVLKDHQRKEQDLQDRSGPSIQLESPWHIFRRFTRDVVRYSNFKEMRQLIVDNGIRVLGNSIGLENVEHAAQAGQIIDVFYNNPDYTVDGLRSRLLQPLSNIGNPEGYLPTIDGFGRGSVVTEPNSVNTRGFGFVNGRGLV